MRFITLLLVFISIKAFAHQPKIINYSPSLKNPHEVIYPEISKAYYGKLKGKSHYFKITSNKDFLFYAGILSPKINENYKRLSLDIFFICLISANIRRSYSMSGEIARRCKRDSVLHSFGGSNAAQRQRQNWYCARQLSALAARIS